MESTGVYWKPIYNLLAGDFELLVVSAQRIKTVPGRKTDVKDAEWIADLLQHGLLRPSFIPSAPQRELREPLPLSDASGGRTGARDQSAAKNAGRRQPQIRRCGKSMWWAKPRGRFFSLSWQEKPIPSGWRTWRSGGCVRLQRPSNAL